MFKKVTANVNFPEMEKKILDYWYSSGVIKKYLNKNKDKKVWGGIAIFVNGTWRYNDNDKEKYEYNPNDLSSWKIIEI